MTGSGASPRDNTQLAQTFLLAAVTGFLLFISDFPVRAWWVQAFAFIPLMVGVSASRISVRDAALAGVFVSLTYVLPSLLVLDFPGSLSLGLGLYMTGLWGAISILLRFVFRRPTPWSALAAGAGAALIEWLDFSLLPFWGTAQCFARVWSAAPWTIQFVSLTGVTGLVFVLFASQALIVTLWRTATHRATTVALLAMTLIAPLIANSLIWRQSDDGNLRVAAMGWTWDDLEAGFLTPAARLLDQVYIPLLERAVAQKARIVVSPEAAFRLTQASRQATLSRFESLAQRHQVWLAVGVFDETTNDNRILFFDPGGTLQAQYTKTHLIPFVETYSAGDGARVNLLADEISLGGMICQDDNFTDLARGYGRDAAQILAIPTNDWLQVKDHHLENSLFRPIENRYAVVRAASNGVSAIINPRGEILRSHDPFGSGPGVIVADVPTRAGTTLYSMAGDWFVLLCALFCSGLWYWRRRSA